MIKPALKAMAMLILFAAAGCGEPEETIMEREMEVEAEETELTDEALIDIMAVSSYLGMELQEDFEADPEAATQEYQRQMEEVLREHGVSLQELEADAAYERQWQGIMQDPGLQQQFQERLQELQQQ